MTERSKRVRFVTICYSFLGILCLSIKKTVLNGIAKSSEQAVKEATHSKSIWLYFEPEVPQKLKNKKMNELK